MTTSRKKVEIFAPAAALLPRSVAELYDKQEGGTVLSVEEKAKLQAEEDKLIEGFGVESLKTSVELSITIEEFLYGLFVQVPKPKSPLRIAQHEKWLKDITDKLLETHSDPHKLPDLKRSDLDLIRHLIEDDQEFLNQSANFSFTNKKTKEIAALPMAAVILTSASQFVECLDILFNNN